MLAVNETLAARYWPGEDAIGKRMRFPGPSAEPWRVVVAVVGNVRSQLDTPAPAEMYFPLYQRTENTMALGLPLALAIGQAIAGLLYGVAPNDVATFAAVAAILSTVALAACYIPARRAMRVDPMVALRSE